MVDVSQVTTTITVNHMPSGLGRYWKGKYNYQRYTKTWKNWCPLCKKANTLADNPKGTYEGEVTCSRKKGGCDADFDGVTGQDKHAGHSWGCLVPADGSETGGDGSISTSSTSTTSHGYDIEKPFQCYIRIEYSINDESPTAPRKKIQFDFTETAPRSYPSFTAPKPVFVNNADRLIRFNVLDKIRVIEGDVKHENNYYLQQISLLHSPPHDGETKPWDDENGTDDSSCKIIIEKVQFSNIPEVTPQNLGAAGKSLLDNMKTLLELDNTYLKLYPSKYRPNDRVKWYNLYTSMDKLVYARQDSNILSIDNRSYNPVNNLINDSIKVYKTQDDPTDDSTIRYTYVQSRDPQSILRYGDCEDVETISDTISAYEAYYKAQTNKKLIHNRTGVNDNNWSYTLTLEGLIDCYVGDPIECIFDNPVLNDTKTIESIEYNYDPNKRPMWRTKVGCGEVDPILKGQKMMEEQRRNTKLAETSYTGGAVYENNVNYTNQRESE